MLVLAITTVGTSYQMACDNGIIRGGGDTGFSAKMNLISMWGIIVPFSAMAAFWWKCPPVAVFFLLKWDQLYKAIRRHPPAQLEMGQKSHKSIKPLQERVQTHIFSVLSPVSP